MNICRATKRRGKYQPLFTDTEVNYCFSISTKPVDSEHQMTVGEQQIYYPEFEWPIRAREKRYPLFWFGLNNNKSV